MSNATLNHRWCVGIDLHKDTLTACTYCACCGEISFRKLACKCRKQICEYFAALPHPHVVAIEAVGFYRWLWEMLDPIVDELILADATQARALACRTDDHVKGLFLRIQKRAGRKAAAVAIARKMLTWMWYAMVKGETYNSRMAA